MSKITRITIQKKNKSRYNIFFEKGKEEAYAFSVDEDILIEFQLRKGLELDESTTEILIQKDSIHKSYSLALNYLSYRMRSKKEIAEYLTKKDVEPDQIPVVVNRLVNEGFLNDREFSEALVRTRLHTTSKGPLLVKKELVEKGVSASLTESALTQYPYEVQLEKARNWVEKKLTGSSKKSFKQQVQSLQQTLMQKGFTQDVIKDALSGVQEDKDEDAEWDAVVYQGEKLVRKYESKFEGIELKHKVKTALFRKGFSFDYIERFLDESIEES